MPVADSGNDEQPIRVIAYALETSQGEEPKDNWYITEHQTAEGLAPNHESTSSVPNYFIDGVGGREAFQSTQTFFISQTEGKKDFQVDIHTPKGDYGQIGIWSKTTPGSLFHPNAKGQVFENGFLSWPGARHWSFPYPGYIPPPHNYMQDLQKALSN